MLYSFGIAATSSRTRRPGSDGLAACLCELIRVLLAGEGGRRRVAGGGVDAEELGHRTTLTMHVGNLSF
jgi:hypothetical protein